METVTSAIAPARPEAADADQLLAALECQGTVAALAATRARALAAIVRSLGAQKDVERGALLYPLLEAGVIEAARAEAIFGRDAWTLAAELMKLGSVGLPAHWGPEQHLPATQAEALRKMLLAVASDARLVLIRLAEQLLRLREAKDSSEEERRRVALETREIYAPLANRLGIWQLKWELEDLSFRYLAPAEYKRIAGWLAAKRVDRERYIESVIAEIRDALAQAGVRAEVAGRPKHIYSIWRKMQRKGLVFEQLFDIRAIRILVDTVADCYAALGVVHGRWPYIPGEFDDYIATPKDNAYRSLHTAVIGPEKLPVEIQIRTRDMHEHAELGVAAHWRYKEGGKGDPAYEQKINWLRQLLEPGDRDERGDDFLERMRAEIFEDRVYALSPRGEVIELPRGATPLDFAYHVHTLLGHRCRGARVNGRMVPLNQPLRNGDQVEIIAGKQPNPSRDWLVPSLGYLVSQRNRAKVRAWFRKLDEDQNRAQGRQMLEREMQRLAIRSVTLPELISEFGLANAEELYQAIGEGDINLAQISGAILRRARPQELPSPVPRHPTPARPGAAAVRIDGVEDLMCNFARCCRPVPPEPICGYITLGRGVSVHREDCANLLRLRDSHRERVIAVDWGEAADRTFPVDVAIQAFDRRGLVRDVSAVLADARISIQSMNSVTHERDRIADMTLRVLVHDLDELARVLGRIQGLPNVISVRRRA